MDFPPRDGGGMDLSPPVFQMVGGGLPPPDLEGSGGEFGVSPPRLYGRGIWEVSPREAGGENFGLF